ncbi:MAG: polysaccharide deacetylase family protein [Candidatus Heimdallarchaeaceae archaeon]
MVSIFICIDFDRDAPFPQPNIKYAVSHPVQISIHDNKILTSTNAISMYATEQTFDLLLDLLMDHDLPAVFYIEGHTLELFAKRNPNKINRLSNPLFEIGSHGYDHEDLSGKDTGIVFTAPEEKYLLEKAKNSIERIVKSKVYGFRAPYMRISSHTFDILEELKFRYSSSTYLESAGSIMPYYIRNGLVEMPVIKTPKNTEFNGMYTYLWPLFEKHRTVNEVVKNFKKLLKNSLSADSYVSINLHLWHFAYSIKEKRFLRSEEVEANIKAFSYIVKTLRGLNNCNFVLPHKWLSEHKDNFIL